jgi:hypothetical protein
MREAGDFTGPSSLVPRSSVDVRNAREPPLPRHQQQRITAVKLLAAARIALLSLKAMSSR